MAMPNVVDMHDNDSFGRSVLGDVALQHPHITDGRNIPDRAKIQGRLARMLFPDGRHETLITARIAEEERIGLWGAFYQIEFGCEDSIPAIGAVMLEELMGSNVERDERGQRDQNSRPEP